MAVIAAQELTNKHALDTRQRNTLYRITIKPRGSPTEHPSFLRSATAPIDCPVQNELRGAQTRSLPGGMDGWLAGWMLII